jgi:hypothetical protein
MSRVLFAWHAQQRCAGTQGGRGLLQRPPSPPPLTLGPLLSVPPEVVAAAMYSIIVLGLPRPSAAI